MTEPCGKEKEIDKLLQAVYGNGNPGIKTSLAMIAQRVEQMPTPRQLKAYSLVGGGLGVLAGLGLHILIKIL